MKTDVLPVVYKIISDAELALTQLIGSNVHLRLNVEDEALSRDKAELLALQNMVCSEFGVSWAIMRQHKRNTNITNARMAYCYLAKLLLGLSLKKIGNTINRDHTTIIYNYRKAQEYMSIDIDPVCRRIKNIQNKFYEDFNKAEAR